MAAIVPALRLVFAQRGYVAGGIVVALATAALYAYSGQVVTVFADGTVFVDPDPRHLAALLVLSLLIGLVVPVQVYALRRAAWGLRQGGSGLLGFVAGLGSLTCCSPLILPAVLSFAGFSGSSLLTMNTALYRYFLPLAALSAALLALSLVLAARGIMRACALMPRAGRPRQANGAGGEPGRAGRRPAPTGPPSAARDQQA